MATVERWAEEYVLATELIAKTRPPAPPEQWEERPSPRRIDAPGRPPELRLVDKAPRSRRRGELKDPKKRAALLHTFWHHELQAAELMCAALLAFPDTPRTFREGLLRIARDEIRHMALYERRITQLGFALGDCPVRDWFWTRVPTCRTPLQIVALLGIGLEGANLDHAARYADRFDAAGDSQSAELQRQVAREEVAHVRFAADWFATWNGELTFDRWRDQLVPPLTPALLRGKPIDRVARARAGLPDAFLDALEHHEDPQQ